MEVPQVLVTTLLLLVAISSSADAGSIYRFKRNPDSSNSDISRAIRDNEAEIQSIKNLINNLKAQTGTLKTILCRNILRKIDEEDDCSAANPFTIDTESRIKDLQTKARSLEDKLDELHDAIEDRGTDYADLKTRTFEALQEVRSSGVRLGAANEENLDELAYLNEFFEDYMDVYRSLQEEYQILKSS